MRLQFTPWLAAVAPAALALLAPALAEAQYGSTGSSGGSCGAPTVTRRFRLEPETVYEERQVTSYKLEYDTVVEERPITVYRDVYETENREKRYKVLKPTYETSEREERTFVQRPVVETRYEDRSYDRVRFVQETAEREEQYTVRRPIYETVEREEQYTVRRPIYETTERDEYVTAYSPVTTYRTELVDQIGAVNTPVYTPGTVNRGLRLDRGGFAYDPVRGYEVFRFPWLRWTRQQNPGYVENVTSYYHNYTPVQVPQTSYMPTTEVRKVPVQSVRYEDQIEVRKVPVQTVRYEESTEVRKVPVTTTRRVVEKVENIVPVQCTKMVTEEVVKKIPVTVMRYVEEERVEPIQVKVLKRVAEEKVERIQRRVEKRVPVTHTYRVPHTSCRWVEITPYGTPVATIESAPSTSSTIIDRPTISGEVQTPTETNRVIVPAAPTETNRVIVPAPSETPSSSKIITPRASSSSNKSTLERDNGTGKPAIDPSEMIKEPEEEAVPAPQSEGAKTSTKAIVPTDGPQLPGPSVDDKTAESGDRTALQPLTRPVRNIVRRID